MATGFLKKNIDYTKRNGTAPAGKTIIKYVNVQARDGVSGEDSFNVQLSPNNVTFKAGSYNAIGATYTINVYATRGAARISSWVFDSSVVGTIPGALTVSANNNGTLNTQLTVTVTDSLSADAGQLVIPVQYSLDAYDGSVNYIADNWDPDRNNLETVEVIYSWTLGKTGQSQYNLDLSNEHGMINCDSSGNVRSDAVRPECQATLSFGSNEAEGAYYDISLGDASVTGLSINHSTGALVYAQNFNFGTPDASGLNTEDTILNVTFIATHDGHTFRKTMTIEKALPGQQGPAGYTPYIGDNGNWWINGEDTGVKAEATDGSTGADAVSRWIDLSASQVKVDASNNILPPTITATAYKQVGGNTPTTDPSCNIKWFPDSSTERDYSGPVSPQASWNYITFKLYFGNAYAGETETVPILKDGKAGIQGQRGAAIRGPVLWDSSSNVNVTGLAKRWFYCGTQTHFGPSPAARPEENDFIDVILHNKQYYMCIDNYEQNAGANWNDVSANWQVADASYNFVAANVILAKNAGIDFLSGNEIYLKDPSGNITAGAAGGNGISFWAGDQNKSLAPFQVNYDGTMTATKGTFGCLEIGTDSVNSISRLEGEYHGTGGENDEIKLSPCYLILDSSENGIEKSVVIAPDRSRVTNMNSNGVIDVSCGKNDTAVYTDGIIKADTIIKNDTTVPSNSWGSVNTHLAQAPGGAGMVGAPGLFGVQIVFQTSSDTNANNQYWTQGSDGYWKFKGIDTRVPFAIFNTIAVQNSVSGVPNSWLGYWAFGASSGEYSNVKIFSGVAGPNITKQAGVLYITI